IDEEAMRALTVLAEALAVIADDGDDGPAQKIARFEEVQQPPDLRVDEGDFAEVGAFGELLPIRRRRRVRRVRVVEVNPAEKACAPNALEPFQRRVSHLVARA